MLVHNACDLIAAHQTHVDGSEATVASRVLGQFLLTSLLLDPLNRVVPGRVVTVSLCSLYSSGLSAGQLQMSATAYRGSEQYARVKRAQVTLNELWAGRIDPGDVVFHAMHPGWAETPGVEDSLPAFRKIVAPLLRSVKQGADTIVWLAAADEPAASTGIFWHDRRGRPIHRLPITRRADTSERRQKLWDWCVEQSDARIG